jgi:hypothetical protein
VLGSQTLEYALGRVALLPWPLLVCRQTLADFLVPDMYSYHDVVRDAVSKICKSPLAPEVVFEAIDRFGGMSHVRWFTGSLAAGKPSHNHYRIAALMNRRILQNVVTPNWDCFIEQCLADPQLTPETRTTQSIVHLHGKLGEDNFVQAGHFRIGFHLEPDIEEALAGIFRGNDCLVLGYSGRDEDIVEVLVESANKANTRVFWSFLKEHGVPETLSTLAKQMPEQFIPIPLDIDSILDLLCTTFCISSHEPKSSPIPPRAEELLKASRSLGHIRAYLVFGFCLSNLGKWNDARWFCEFATDAAHSSTLCSDGPLYGPASEAYRFAALCTACTGNTKYAEMLSHFGDDDFGRTSLASFKSHSARYLQKGLIALCGQDLRSAASWLQKAVDAYRLDFGMHPDQHWPMLEAAVGNGLGLYMTLIGHPDAVRQNEAVLLCQERVRNVCGHCCTLLSLALSYYKRRMLTDSRLALVDCIHLSELAGNLVCAAAARANLRLLDGGNSIDEPAPAPVKDASTGWGLSVDPFALYFHFAEP